MSNLHYSIQINAPRTHVWDVMLSDATYREWSSAFMPGSYFQGDWSQGSKILFLGPGAEGEEESGMSSVVKENRKHEFVSVEHKGEIRDGIEVLYKESGFENYTFEDKDGGTEVLVDLLGLPEEYQDMFNEMWPKALERLKELAEK